MLTLNDASLSLQRLQDTVRLQNQTQTILESLETRLTSQEELSNIALEVLDNTTRDISIIVAEVSRALVDSLGISLADFDVQSTQTEILRLEGELSAVGVFVNETGSFLDTTQGEFSMLSTNASQLLARSQELDAKAALLLRRSRDALLLANDSTTQGNAIIAEANDLLRQLRGRSSMAQNLSAGLDEVLRNVNEAERLSLLAEEEVRQASEEVQAVTDTINVTAGVLEEVSETLRETMMVRMQSS